LFVVSQALNEGFSLKNFPKKFVPKKALESGMSDTLGRGPEMAVSVLVFTVIGLVIDSQVGTLPFVTIALVVFSLVGNFIRMYYTYNGRMKALEEQRSNKSMAHQRDRSLSEN
jgi:F0F1-type ATP synthase assembly protein I